MQRDKAQSDIMEELLQKNAYLLGSDCAASFAYKGMMYYGMGTPRIKGTNRLIHPDMLAEVSATIDNKDFDVITEENQLMNYIGNVLIFANTIEDMYKLIPERINETVSRIDPLVFNIKENLNNEQVFEFMENNRQGLLAFKRLFITRLLLS